MKSKGFAAPAEAAPAGIERIIVEDSSKIDLPDQLAGEFPASSNQKGHQGAGLRLQGAFEWLSGEAPRVELTEYYRQDTTAAKDIPPLLRPGDLLIRDLGYLVHEALNAVVEKRLRKTHQESNRRGKQVSSEVEALLGWTILITSLERDGEAGVGVEQLIKIYELRWRVEIIFKSLKSCTPLKAIATHRSNADHIQTLLHAWLCLVVMAVKTGAFALVKRTAGATRKLVPNLLSLLKTMPKAFELLHLTLFVSSAPSPGELLAKWLAQSEYHDRYEAGNKRRNMARMTLTALGMSGSDSPTDPHRPSLT